MPEGYRIEVKQVRMVKGQLMWHWAVFSPSGLPVDNNHATLKRVALWNAKRAAAKHERLAQRQVREQQRSQSTEETHIVGSDGKTTRLK